MRAHSAAPGTLAHKNLFFNTFLPPKGLPETPPASIEPAVAILDKRGLVSFSSQAMGNLFNSSREQLLGREVSTLFPGLPFTKQTPGDNLAFAESWEHEATWRKLNGLSPDGDSVLLEVSLKKLNMNADQYILLGMRPAREDSAPAEELARLIDSARGKTDAVMITDTAGIIHFINAALEQASGYALDDVVGQPATVITPDFHDSELHDRMWQTLLAGNDFRGIFSKRRKSGEIFHEDTHIRPFVGNNGIATHFVATSRELNAPLQTTLLRLQREAYHDALTGLPNRTLFLDRLRQSLARASRENEKFSLLYLDLDNFKEINDACGHAAGDAVLRATAGSLNASVRNEDTVARLGGDEFALILLDIHRHEDIEFVANKILHSLAHGAAFEDRLIPVHASLGASRYPDDGENGDSLLQRADAAMYTAKSAGGQCVHFFSTGESLRRAGETVHAVHASGAAPETSAPEASSAVPPQASA